MPNFSAGRVAASIISDVFYSIGKTAEELWQAANARSTSSVWGKVGSGLSSVGRFIEHNPISNIVVGVVGVGVGIIAFGATFGASSEYIYSGLNSISKGFYKIKIGDWTGEETDLWWPFP